MPLEVGRSVANGISYLSLNVNQDLINRVLDSAFRSEENEEIRCVDGLTQDRFDSRTPRPTISFRGRHPVGRQRLSRLTRPSGVNGKKGGGCMLCFEYISHIKQQNFLRCFHRGKNRFGPLIARKGGLEMPFAGMHHVVLWGAKNADPGLSPSPLQIHRFHVA